MFSFFKKDNKDKKSLKKTVTSSVSLEKNGLVFRFELSQEYAENDNLLDIKTDQIISCIEMLNETISDLELQDKEDKKIVPNKVRK